MAGFQPAAGNAGLIGAIATPRTNYAALSAARNEALQLGAYNAQLQEQKALETQQAAANQEAYLQQLNSLPFMGRDVQKLQAHVKGEEQQVYKRIRDGYKGDVREWFRIEGPGWMNDAANRLKTAPFYQQAVQNVQNVMAGQEAHNKGENLVGTIGPDGYRTGEQQLQDFLSGRSDAYQHTGSYKPEDDFKGIRETYAPGALPWQRVAMSEQGKLNHLIDTHGATLGMDKYLRQHKGTSVYYKTDPITKMYDFQRDQGRYAMEQQRLNLSIRDHNQMSGLRAKQGQLLDLNIAKKQQELSGTDSRGLPFDYDLLSKPQTVEQLRHEPGSSKTLSNGYDLSKLNALAGVTLFGEGDQTLARQLGLQKGKNGFTGGNFKTGFTTANGVHAIDLSKSRYTTVGFDPKVYYNVSEVTGEGRLPKDGVNGFAKVILQFNDDDDADAAGLYKSRFRPGSLLESTTKAGTGVYDPVTKQATIFVPAGPLGKSFFKEIQKNIMGTKARNEGASDVDYPFLNTTF